MSLTINPGVIINPGVVLTGQSYPLPVSDGLVLNLDAGDVLSYPGTGSTWTDLVSAKEFMLYNNPTYSSSNGGYLTFEPASSQYADATSLPSTLNNWAVEVWLYHDATNMGNNNSPCIVTEVYAGNPINFTIGNTSDSFPSLQIGSFNGGWASNPQGTSLTTGNWYQIVGTWDGSTMKLYINGSLVSNYTYESFTSLRGGAGIRLMRRWDAPQYWGGGLAIVRIYDNDIGLSGVTQNYNSSKARFGL